MIRWKIVRWDPWSCELLFIAQLWVAENLRGKGMDTQRIDVAEKGAIDSPRIAVHSNFCFH